MTTKVHFFDKVVIEFYYKIITAISMVFSLFFIFVEIPKECKNLVGFVFFWCPCISIYFKLDICEQ